MVVRGDTLPLGTDMVDIASTVECAVKWMMEDCEALPVDLFLGDERCWC